VRSRRRHLLIWSAVTAAHLAALAAVWSSGAPGVGPTPPREGGLMIVLFTPEPVALPGEQSQGQALGAGLPAAQPPRPAAATSVAPGPVVAELVPAPEPAAAPGPAPSAAAPVALAAAPLVARFTPPAFVERVEPLYPERARRAGIEGVATVRVRLDPAGAVVAVELLRTSGSRLLDDAALAAARDSRFAPASRDAAQVASEALATYRFELR
jgi:TonB family protein